MYTHVERRYRHGDKHTDGQTKQTDTKTEVQYTHVETNTGRRADNKHTYIHTYRQTDRQTYRQTGVQYTHAERQVLRYRQTDRQTDRQSRQKQAQRWTRAQKKLIQTNSKSTHISAALHPLRGRVCKREKGAIRGQAAKTTPRTGRSPAINIS